MSESLQLPPYLSYSTAIITGPGGSIETSSALVQIPLTYYGPSIPLGTDGVWTYGGPTSPASTPTASVTALGTASFSSLPIVTSGLSSVPTGPTTALGTASGPSSASNAPTTALATATFSSSPAITSGPSLASSVPTTALATATFASSPVGTSGLSTSALATATFASTAASPAPSVSILISTVTVIISVTPSSSGSSLSTTLSTSSVASSAATSSSSAIPSSSTSITSILTSASISSSASTISLSSSLSSSSASSSSSSQSSSTTPPSSTTPSPTSSATLAPTSTPIIKGAVIGIVVGTILGSVLLFLLFLIFLRWRRRRQNGGYQTPIWTGWEIVDPMAADGDNDQDRPPGEGSPRGSGEEADSLLRRSGAVGATTMEDTSRQLASVPSAVFVAGAGTAAAAAEGSHSGTNGSHSSDSTVSDYGVILQSDYADDPEGSSPTHIPARPSTELGFIGDSRGHIIPPSELLRMDAEEREQEHLMRNEPSSRRKDPERYSPLLPPPRLDPDRTAQFSSQKTSGGSVHDLDDPMVLTARRVRMSQIGPRAEPEVSVHDEPSPEAGPSTGWGSLGLGGIARLSRLSWFKNFRENLQDSPTRSSSKHESRPTSYVSRGLSDNDVESGRALLGDEYKRSSRAGLDPRGERPISTVSAKSAVSGSTVYHDARSLAGTPPPLPLLPRAFLSGSPTDVSQSHGGATEPPSYESGQAYGSHSQAVKDSDVPHGVDILDLPAPPSTSQFSSASSRGTMPFPPGLIQLPTPRSWYESSSSEGENITIDVLEDEPPRAGDGWRVLARNANLSQTEHRSSFGIPQFVYSHDLTAISEVGSLHSMRSHLNPFSARSSGSAPASSRHNFSGSNSSKPSGHSHGRTTSSGISLAHSGSISSDGRRRLRGPVSPALSAFGYPDSPSPTGQFTVPTPPPPPYIPRSPLGGAREATVRSVTTGTPGTSTAGSADTEATYMNNLDYMVDHTTADSHLLSMPWATGLDDD